MFVYIIGELEKIEAEKNRLILNQEFNWETLLMPVPIGIATLVDLIVMASTLGDFSLDEHQPKGGFQFVKHPKSFQASLVQISFAGHRAFLKAHVNMDKILLLTRNVPGFIVDILEILESGDEGAIKCMLPDQLEGIVDVATQCSKLSKDVIEEFDQVIALTEEVRLSCTELKGIKGTKNTKAEKDLEVMEIRKREAKKVLDDLEDSKIRMEKQTVDAYEQTSRAIETMPGTVETLRAHAKEKFINLVTLNWRKTEVVEQIHTTAQSKLKAAQVS